MSALRPNMTDATEGDEVAVSKDAARDGAPGGSMTGGRPGSGSGSTSMNRYGRLARDHWKSTDPGRYSQIQDPEGFFLDLGETVEFQIQDLWLHLAGPDPIVPENTLDKVGRLNVARLQAEELVLADLVWLTRPTRRPRRPWNRRTQVGEYLFDKTMWEAQNEDQDIY